jgi:polyferredoxin
VYFLCFWVAPFAIFNDILITLKRKKKKKKKKKKKRRIGETTDRKIWYTMRQVAISV